MGDALGDLPQDKQIVFYCKTGVRSAEVLAVVKGAGFADAVHVGGGVIGLGQPDRARAARPTDPPRSGGQSEPTFCSQLKAQVARQGRQVERQRRGTGTSRTARRPGRRRRR